MRGMRKALAALFIAAALVSGAQLARAGAEQLAGRSRYAELAALAGPGRADGHGGALRADGAARAAPDFAALARIDPNVVAWVRLEAAGIDYPVVQGPDNRYYLTHLFGGGENRAGAVFLDAGCSPDFSDAHSVLYGHHRRDGQMFANLGLYADPDFWRRNPCFALYTPAGAFTVRVFAGYVTAADADAWRLDLAGEADFLAWCRAAAGRSAFDSGILPRAGQRVLTLSTCDYAFDNARFVLHGILEPAEYTEEE